MTLSTGSRRLDTQTHIPSSEFKVTRKKLKRASPWKSRGTTGNMQSSSGRVSVCFGTLESRYQEVLSLTLQQLS